MKRVLRVLCAIAVFIGSAASSIAFYRAASHHHVTPGYLIAVMTFAIVGFLAFASIYFILDLG